MVPDLVGLRFNMRYSTQKKFFDILIPELVEILHPGPHPRAQVCK